MRGTGSNGTFGMKVLVVGSGGREHALCWALAASPLVEQVLCAPGNAGIAEQARCLPVAADDVVGLVALAVTERVGLVVVGPEVPLVLGLVDRLRAAGIKAFGPTAAAARLEGSKAFTKAFCARHAIPTAAFRTFGRNEEAAALAHVEAQGAPIVVKADGLAAGKGVVVAMTAAEAMAAVRDAFAGGFGTAGSTIVVEEFLDGEEASLFALCDGVHALEIGTAQDHKRAFDGDQGPNTGGMGAYSPAPRLDAAMVERVMSEIVRPTLAGMATEGAPFTGILYAGLMLTADGPKVIEFNCRFGDPETQVILPMLDADFAELCLATAEGRLGDLAPPGWHTGACVGVVLAAGGYPGAYASGRVIRGLDVLPDGGVVFHAGTACHGADTVTAGGRVLTAVARGDDLASARNRAYEVAAAIDFDDAFYRRDIAAREIPTN